MDMNAALTTKPNRRIALLIATIMALTLWAGFPLQARAASTGANIDLTDENPATSGTGWSYNNNVYTITDGAEVTISGITTTKRVEIAINAKVTVTLNGVNITSSNNPFKLNSSAHATVKLQGTNELTATANTFAGLNAPTGTALTITSASGVGSSDGFLTAKGNTSGSSGGAGIGGGAGAGAGTINITGGTINAAGGGTSYGAAGIGGGDEGAGGTINISGGTINAASGALIYGAAGIGGGYYGAGGTINISGGTINATGDAAAGGGYGGGAGIGGGAGAGAGTINITGGTINATSVTLGAGIGGGANHAGGNITIKGGTIYAKGGRDGAGIGGGFKGDGGNIKISGGTIHATAGIAGNAGTGATGIGGGNTGEGNGGGAGSIDITGGVIITLGSHDIGGGVNRNDGSISISGGTVIGTSSGIGKYNENSKTTSTTISGNAVILATAVNNYETGNGANGRLVGSEITINAGGAPKTLTINVDLTIPAGSTLTIPAGVKLIIPAGKTLTIDENADFFVEEGAIFTNNGTFTGKLSGATVSDIEIIEFAANSITIKTPVQTAHFTNQKLEYAFSTTDELPTSWTQISDTPGETVTISGLNTSANLYYVFARSQSDTTYNAGAAKSLLAYPIIVTFDSQLGTAVTTTPQNKLATQTVDEVSETTRQGYTFDGWYSQQNGDGTAYTLGASGTQLSEATGVDLQENAGTITLYAKWIEKTGYKVVYDTQGATTGAIQKKEGVKWTDNVIPDAPNKTGYIFAGWNVTSGGTGSNIKDAKTYAELATSDTTMEITLTAQWDAKPVTITYDPGTLGTALASGSGTYDSAIDELPTVTVTSPTRYEFIGWYSGEIEFEEDATPLTVTNGVDPDDLTITLTAKYVGKAVAINYALIDPAKGSMAGNGSGAGTYGSPITTLSTVTPTAGYTFDGWFNAETEFEEGVTLLTTDNGVVDSSGLSIALTATLTGKPVEIIYNTNGHGEGQNGGNGTYGSAIGSLPELSEPGWIFGGWYADETLTNNKYGDTTDIVNGVAVESQNESGTLNLYAKWSAKSVTVNYQYNYGTAGIYDTASGTYGGKIAAAPTVPIRAGYTFGGWHKEVAATNAWTFGEEGTALNADNGVEGADNAPTLSLYAKWTANPPQTYTVTVMGGTGGGPFAAGDKVSITADTLSGKMFDRWTGGVDFADANSATTSFVMPANAVTVTANYKDAPVVAPPGSQVEEEGENIKVTLPGDGGSVIVPPGSTVMSGENEGEIEVTLSGDGGTVIVPPGSQVEEEGDNIKVTLPDGGGSVVVPPGSTVMSGENEGEIEVTLPGGGGTVIVPPGSTVMSGENKGEIEVTLSSGDIVIVPPGSTVMSGENKGEIEVTLPGDGGSVVVPPGSTVDAEGNVTAPPIGPPAINNGWVKQEDGTWKYIADGEAKTGWLYDTDYKAWFYLGTDGAMQTGWVYDQKDKAWYYLASNGKMVAGKWLHDTDDSWYYLSGNGKMLTGKQTIGGKVYSFRGNGAWIG
jgi:uncharacterized repeat protein (TIGR02543 family)